MVDRNVLDLRVEQLRRESDCVLSVLLVDPHGGLLPSWAPGAHVDLLSPAGLRQYSLCGDPADRWQYQIAVLRELDSTGGSRYVHEQLRPGDVVEVSEPRNNFQLTPAEEYLFIAGGIGITPILTMVRAAQQKGHPWRLVYGGRARASMAFAAELEQIGPSVEVVDESVFGPLDLDALLSEPRAGVEVYCCGPEGLLAAVEARSTNWAPGSLHVERFKARQIDGLTDRPFHVVCNRSGVELDVSADQSLLDALDTVGIYVGTACQEGICGSCQTPVLDGVVEHRDSVLSDMERAAGDTMMVCVSRAQAGLLVLDL